MCIRDSHWGYGFCIGGVCATDPDKDGIISPGGVGYDINCGVRLIRSNLTYSEVQPQIRKLVSQLFRDIPTGIGRKGNYPLSDETLIEVLLQGPRYFVNQMGLGCPHDIEFTEAEGRLKLLNPIKSALVRGHGEPINVEHWGQEIIFWKFRLLTTLKTLMLRRYWGYVKNKFAS